MARRFNRRGILNWDPKDPAQRNFILLQFLLMAGTMIYLLYLIFATVDQSAKETTISVWSGWEAFFGEINLKLLVRISILFVIVFVAQIVLGLFYLQRLIGPMERTRRILVQIAEGNTPEPDLSFREEDFPRDLARDLSRALKRIRSYQGRSQSKS